MNEGSTMSSSQAVGRLKRRSSKHGVALILAIASSGGGRTVAAETFTNLGVLAGGTNSIGWGISPDGTTVVGQSFQNGNKAFRWTSAGGMQVLVLPSSGFSSAAANATSASASVITGNYLTTTTSFAFRWTSAGTQLIAGPTGATFAEGQAISGDGSVIVGRFGVTSSIVRAFRWTSTGGAVDLGIIPGSPADASLQARGISADGAVVVGRSTSSAGNRGFRWTASGGMVALPLAAGTSSGDAYGASADGAIVCGSCTVVTGNIAHASRWTSAGLTEDLGIAPGATQSVAYTMNSSGSLLAGGPVAFVWTRSSGMVNLQTYLTARGVNLAGWTLSAVNSVSADGRSLTGFGSVSGQTRAFLVTGLTLACPADFDQSGGSPTVQDILDYLDAFFSGLPTADFNGVGGLTVQDIFDFLNAYFAGCP